MTATLDTEAFTPPRNGLAQETCASLNTGGAPNLRTTTTGQARIAKACYPSASVRAGLPTRRRYVDTLMATFDGDRSEKERSGERGISLPYKIETQALCSAPARLPCPCTCSQAKVRRLPGVRNIVTANDDCHPPWSSHPALVPLKTPAPVVLPLLTRPLHSSPRCQSPSIPHFCSFPCPLRQTNYCRLQPCPPDLLYRPRPQGRQPRPPLSPHQ